MRNQIKFRASSLRLPWLLGCGVLVFGLGCAGMMRHGQLTKQAETQYQNGQHDDAVRSLVGALKAKPGYPPADGLLRQCLSEVYAKHESAVKAYESRKDWDSAVQEYDRVGSISSEVSGLRGGYPAIDVSERREKAAKNGAKMHVANGKSKFSTNDFESAASEFLAAHRLVADYMDAQAWAAKSYYHHGKSLFGKGKFKESATAFRRASETVSGYEDSEARYKEARERAIRRIAVMPFGDASGRGLGDAISERVVSAVMEGNPEFIEFVTRDHLVGIIQEKGLKSSSLVDQESALKIGKLAGVDSFIFGKVLSARASISPEQAVGPRRNSIKQRVYGDKSKGIPDQDVILSVNYTIRTKSSLAKISASYQIVDAKTGGIRSAKTHVEEVSDLAKWVTFVGAESAIPPSALAGMTPDKNEPADPESLMDQATQSLSAKLSRELFGYFQ